MSARSQPLVPSSEEGFNLVPALRDSLSPGVIVLNHLHQVVSCSPEAQRMLGLVHPESSQVPSSSLPATILKIVREVLTSRMAHSVRIIELNLGAQSPAQFQVSTQWIATGSGEALVILTLTNVTGFVRIEQNIERLDRLATAGTLAAGMAHEIKNALVAVKTFVELLLEKNKDAELAEIVGREISRVNAIVRQLLKFGTATRPERAPVRLHDVLEHSLRMVQHQLDGKLISLNRSFRATSDMVQGDNQQLEQVFVNLFLNAVDATGANGSLTVETEFVAADSPAVAAQLMGQPHVRVTVADTGAGISPENLAQMFEPFFTTKNHGTGLGLPITRRIVQEHQGLITVESQPNKGTVFSIVLPTGPATV